MSKWRKELKRRILKAKPRLVGEIKRGFYVDSSRRLILKSLFTLDLRASPYYGSLSDLLHNFLYFLSLEYLKSDEIVEAIRIARAKSHRKASIIVAAHALEREHIVDLLRDMPIPMLLTFLSLRREVSDIAGGLSYRKKRALEEILLEMPTERSELYAMKYPKKFRRLLRLVHPRGYRNRENEKIRRRLLGRGEATERLKAYECVLRGECGEEEILRYQIPREAIRRIGLKRFDIEKLLPILSGSDIAMQARSLLRYVSEEKLIEALREKRVRAYHAARAFISLRGSKISEAFLEIAESEELRGLEDYEILIDASGSMHDILMNASFKATLYLLAKRARAMHAFNHCIGLEEIDIEELLELEGACGTPLVDSINELSKRASASKLIIFTDEQENVSLEEDLRLSWEEVIVINPMPSAVSYIDEVKDVTILKAPGKTIDDVRVSMRLSNKLKRTAGRIEDLISELRSF